MKQLRLIVLVLITLPLGLWAQEERLPNTELFYATLAEKDAKYELNYSFASVEDERDFWKDQKTFERVLAFKNNTGYQYYLKHKAKYYREHKLICFQKGTHSEIFAKHTSVYFDSYSKESSLEGIALANGNK